MEEIKIQTVLSEIDQSVLPDGTLKNFSIRYVHLDGTLGEKTKASKRGKSSEKILSDEKEGKNTQAKFNFRKRGIIKIYDEVKGEHKNIKVHLITHFNGIRVKH